MLPVHGHCLLPPICPFLCSIAQHYFNFFFGRNWLVCPHFYARSQQAALNNGGRSSLTHLLPAIRSTRWESGVALPTDGLVTVIFGSERFERGFDDTAAEAEDQVECGFFLDVVVG